MLLGAVLGLVCGLWLGAFFRVAALVLVHAGALAVLPLVMVAGSASLVTDLAVFVTASVACQAGYLLAACGAMSLRQPGPATRDLSAM